ncbi:MAG: hypothetical protein K2I70_03085, partial [Bacilli bacterium]|nr:hypothetical protein [Bacilli bacterium]
FMQLFQNVLKSAKKRDDNKQEEELDNKVFIGIRDVDGKIVSGLDEYGVDYLVVEILTDKEVSSYIENSYVKPIKGMLMEYISLFTDEDEEDYADMFTTLFVQSKEYIAYQALLNLIIMDAISNGTKVSDTIREIDRNKLVSESKKMILSYQGFDEYREEIEATMKLLLDAQTQ